MIDPRYVTNYSRSIAELEEFYLFTLVVAGKTAIVQAKLLDAFLTSVGVTEHKSPFEAMRELAESYLLLQALKASRLGQYTRLTKAIELSLDLDLKNCSVDDLERIPGIGSKTARFFLLHTRPNQKVAVLDTHVLRYMRDQGLTTQKGTPPKGPKYSELEQTFINLANTAKMSLADFDLHIWRTYSGNV